MAKYRLGSLLVRKGIITDKELNEALAYQSTHAGMAIGEVFIALNMVSKKQIDHALCKQSSLRKVAALVSFIMAPLHVCHANDDSIESLPEYQYTQVADQNFAFSDGLDSFHSAGLPAVGVDVLSLASGAAAYLYQGGIDVKKVQLNDVPIKFSVASTQSDHYEVNFSIHF